MDIGIVNTWGLNRGDEAMLRVLVRFLKANDPSCSITIYTHGWLDLPDFPGIKQRKWLALGEILPRMPGRFQQGYFRMANRTSLPFSGRANKKFNHDFVISSPAGPYFGDFYPSTLEKCLLPLTLAGRKGIPHGILATSAGPFENSSNRELIETGLEKALFWTVREPISFKNQKNVTGDWERVLGSDLVFAHDVYNECTADENHSRTQTYKNVAACFDSIPTIAVTLNYTQYFATDSDHGKFRYSDYIEKMGTFLVHVVEKTNHQIAFMAHFYGNEQELRLIKDVSDKIPDRDKVMVVNSVLNSDDQIELYKKVKFTISNRYHPTIFSVLGECPFLCIRHQFKVEGMLEMIGDQRKPINTISTLEDWISAFDSAWDDREAFKEQLRTKKPEMVAGALKHLDCLGNHMGFPKASH